VLYPVSTEQRNFCAAEIDDHHWKPALQSFQLMFGEERVPLAAL
jgi:hypothetical protein